jgi:threonine dehydrogenase-like Zn-dependent dehydrogenase
MLAMTYKGPYRIRIEDKPMPKIEHPMDAVVRVTSAGICGSDLHLYHGLVPDTRINSTFGHEFTGVVEEVGAEVKNLKTGDRVLVPFPIACGSCFFCRKELYASCHNANPNSSLGGIFGYSHSTGGFDGGQAEYVRVPYADTGPKKIPDWLAEDDALLLTDVVPTGYQAAEMGEIKEGDTVVIFGAGPVGIMAAKCAQLLGAGRVIVVDHVDYRLDFVREYAKCEVLNFLDTDDIVLRIKKMTDYLGADVCIDCVGCEADGNFMWSLLGVKMKLQAGAATALQWCINSVRKGGTISLVGVYGSAPTMVPIGNILNKGITLRGSQTNVHRYLPRLMEHVQAGRLNPKEIITHRLPLADVADAYHIFSTKQNNCIKTVLVPPKAA